MKILLSGGGTGGHVNPALAIGEAIEKHDPAAEIHYVGTPGGIENRLVPAKYPMHHVEIQGLRRRLTLENVKTAVLTVKAFRAAEKLLQQLKPDAVIGTGGYVCWPVCAAAASKGIPCFLHESNAEPGFAVKMLERKADVIFVNFAKTAEKLPSAKETLHVGTPLKSGYYTWDKESARRELRIPAGCRKVVLSFGGSLGAQKLNEEMLGVFENYGKKHPEVLFFHAAGDRCKEEFAVAFEKTGLKDCPNIRCSDYIYDMPKYMAAADLVICRSGAMTLSEISVMGKPSVLIPSPNVTNDQQTKNARLLSDKGAAVLLKESELSENRLSDEVARLLSSGKELENMGMAAKGFAVRNAEETIFRKIAEVVEEKKKRKK